MAWESYFDGSWSGAADSSDARAGKWTTETDTGSLGSIVGGKYVIARPTASSTASYLQKTGLAQKTRYKVSFSLTIGAVSGTTAFRTSIFESRNASGLVLSVGLYKDAGQTIFNKIQVPDTSYSYSFSVNTPYLFEIESQISTDAVTADGWHKVWINGALIANIENVTTTLRYVDRFYIGDIYVSNAQIFTSTYEGFTALSYKADPVSEGTCNLVNTVANLTSTGFGTTTLTQLLKESFDNYSSITQDLAAPYPELTVFSNLNATQPVVTTSGRSGKAIQHNYSVNSAVSQNDWQRTAIDLGQIADELYITFWLKIDKSESGTTTWQWKPYQISSSEYLYYDLPTGYPSDDLPASAYAYNQTHLFTSCWWNEATQSFFNSAGDCYYYDNVTDFSPEHGVSAAATTYDRFVFGQWQRIELYAKRASGSGVADGIWTEWRVGRNSYNFEYRNAITHLTGNAGWRYFVLSHAIESVYSGTLNLDVTFDDLYIHTTQARVEIGDSPYWAECTHREIQQATSWSDTSIEFTVNRGTFNVGDTVYAYVVTDAGTVKQVGGPFQIPADAQSGGGVRNRAFGFGGSGFFGF